MDIQLYETFIEVASTLSFREASENLGVVQSTVSNRIQALEDFYKKPLFNRSNKRVELTPAGASVLPYAIRVVALQNEALKTMERISNVDKRFRLGIAAELIGEDLYACLNAYTSRYPEIELSVQVDRSKTLNALLLDNTLDAIFVYGKSTHSKIHYVPHKKERLLFVMGSLSERFHEERISKSDLKHCQLVYKDYGKKFNEWLCQYLPSQYAYAVSIQGTMNPVELIKGSVLNGFVLASDLEKADGIDNIKVTPVKDMDLPYFQTYFAYLDSESPSEGLVKFIDALNRQE